MLNWLLIFVPVTLGLELLAPASHTLIFLTSCLAIVPLAGWLGHATEELARRAGEGVGGLLNATFGNAAELIIAIAALQKGLYSVVKASLTGSIIGNILLVLGGAALAGGIRHKQQKFNTVAARAQATLLTLAAIALVMPAAFHYLAGTAGRINEKSLSLEISVVLLCTYGAHLLFSLHTHKQLFTGSMPAVPLQPPRRTTQDQFALAASNHPKGGITLNALDPRPRPGVHSSLKSYLPGKPVLSRTGLPMGVRRES
jgi:Ca2+:H+ antiporter